MNGIINVYKEKGYTSFDVVAKLRGICRQKKVGHTGTLDPDAEGVLPVCLGTATKVCGLLTDKDKEYEAVLLLGIKTDTQDMSGKILQEKSVGCTQEELLQAAASFVGEYQQTPPMYSALKVNGEKLCNLARAGIEIERRPRTVQIFSLEILWIQMPRVKLKVHCSKGTYIRTLCHDIGKKLGCGGCMEQLTRIRSGTFCIADAKKIGQIEQLAAQNRIGDILMPVDQLFTGYPAVKVHAGFQRKLENGNRLPKQAFYTVRSESFDGCEKLRVYCENDFFGIYQWDAARRDYKPEKIFWQRNDKKL